MCTKAEVKDIVHEEIKPINKRINGLLGVTVAGLITFIGTAVFIGMAWGTLQSDVDHNKELLIVRSSDRFYKQDGEILEEKFKGLVQRQDSLEEQYRVIDAKLDRLIEER